MAMRSGGGSAAGGSGRRAGMANPTLAYTSTVDPRRTVYALGAAGMELRQRGWFRSRRRFIPYRDIAPEYTITQTDDSRHVQGLIIIIVILLLGIAVAAARFHRWSWLLYAQPAHWWTAAGVGTIGLLTGLLLILRHRGPQVRYRFTGRRAFVIGGSVDTKEDLDIFVNLLTQRIWSR